MKDTVVRLASSELRPFAGGRGVVLFFKHLFIWLHRVLAVACGILVSQPGIEPVSPALEGRFSTIGPPGKSPGIVLNTSIEKS